MYIRRNIIHLTDQERQDYVDGVIALKNKALPKLVADTTKVANVYDWFVMQHNAGHKSYHQTPWFLPWHRAMLLQFEKEMRDVLNKPFVLPYWDWTWDTHFPDPISGSFMWKSNFMGGSGYPITGPFAKWPLAPVGDRPTATIARALGQNPDARTLPDTTAVDKVMPVMPYDEAPWGLYVRNSFRQSLEIQLHNRVHAWVGGTMGKIAISPNDPAFYLHHCNVDRIWANWQIMHGDNGAYLPAKGTGTKYDEPLLMPPWDGANPDAELNSWTFSPADVATTYSLELQDLSYVYGDYLAGGFQILNMAWVDNRQLSGTSDGSDYYLQILDDPPGYVGEWSFEYRGGGNYRIRNSQFGKYVSVGYPNDDHYCYFQYDDKTHDQKIFEWKISLGIDIGPDGELLPYATFESVARPGQFMRSGDEYNAGWVYYDSPNKVSSFGRWLLFRT